jgi:N6-L-threonylcarbamoyladenine synthase
MNWPAVSAEALERAGVGLNEFDAIAATRGPGLVGSLLVGLSLGKALAWSLEKPFYAVHHLEGHLYSPFLTESAHLQSEKAGFDSAQPAGRPASPEAPASPERSRRADPDQLASTPLSQREHARALSGVEGRSLGEVSTDLGQRIDPEVPEHFAGLIVSGGHTTLVRVAGERITTLAETRDDAIGEAFDKLGKRIGLPYPQGPRVDELAERGEPDACPLTVAAGVPGGGALFFSYSGLKTQAVLRLEAIEKQLGRRFGEAVEGDDLPREVLDLLAGFRRSAVAQLVQRLDRAYRERSFPVLAVSGGVAANRLLRREIPRWAEKRGVDARLVSLRYSGDNAAMIAHAALRRARRGDPGDPFDVEAESRVPF